MVVPRFVQQALRGEPLTVYGDGEQTRCFTDVRDTVEAMVRLMETPSAVGETFNVGNGREITIGGLARKVIELTGSGSEIRYLPYEAVYERGFEDMRRRVPDSSKLQRMIGFAPAIPLESALASIIDYFRSSTAAEPRSASSRRQSPITELNGAADHPNLTSVPERPEPQITPAAVVAPLSSNGQ
jgi:UDP-glucose 4-epimerase